MSCLNASELEALVNKYASMLFKIAYSYTKNNYDSDDIVQETFIKFYQAHKTLKDEEHIKNWLIRVTINHSLNVIKHKKKEILVDNDSLNGVADENNETQEKDFIYECVSLLKDKYKTIIILYYYDDYSIKEIGEILNISESNVKIRLSRARDKLKILIDERRKVDGKR